MLGWIERLLFAPDGGGWAYTYVQRPDLISLIAIIVAVPMLLLLWRRTEAQIQQHPARVVAQWLVVALLLQWGLHAIAPYSLTAKLESVSANGFYTVSTQYSATEFLRQFNTIAATLPMHVQANLPGKVLLFHLLRGVSDQTTVLAALLILISTVGGALAYVVAWQWFHDRRVAVVAAIFYLLFPARIYFLPLLNTVAPVFMLIALALTGAWARTGALRYPIALGPLLYALALFDPLPLAAGVCGVALMSQSRDDGRSWRQLAQFAWIASAAFLVTHTVAVGALGFDLLAAYRFAIQNAIAFNAAQDRPYWFWIGHNLKDFAIGIGVAQTLALGAGASHLMRGRGAVISASVVACLLVVDLLGVNRGEVPRLWIFLGVLFQILAARAAAHDRRLTTAVIAVSIAQVVLCIRSIAWVIP